MINRHESPFQSLLRLKAYLEDGRTDGTRRTDDDKIALIERDSTVLNEEVGKLVGSRNDERTWRKLNYIVINDETRRVNGFMAAFNRGAEIGAFNGGHREFSDMIGEVLGGGAIERLDTEASPSDAVSDFSDFDADSDDLENTDVDYSSTDHESGDEGVVVRPGLPATFDLTMDSPTTPVQAGALQSAASPAVLEHTGPKEESPGEGPTGPQDPGSSENESPPSSKT